MPTDQSRLQLGRSVVSRSSCQPCIRRLERDRYRFSPPTSKSIRFDLPHPPDPLSSFCPKTDSPENGRYTLPWMTPDHWTPPVQQPSTPNGPKVTSCSRTGPCSCGASLLTACLVAGLWTGSRQSYAGDTDASGVRNWTLDETMDQLRMYPNDAYLQYVALQVRPSRRIGRHGQAGN